MSENLAYRVKRCCAKLLTHKSNFNRHLGARRIELLTRGARSDARLARLLLLLANFGKEGTPEPIVGKYSQEMLAEMIGTTRSRVSFFMNKFRKLGFIEYNGKLEVHKSLLNMVLHEKPEIKEGDEAIGAD